jgi:aspartate aminotransferase
VVLPGAVVEVPGWFRISLTASDAMVEASVVAFDRARERAIAEAPEPAPV